MKIIHVDDRGVTIRRMRTLDCAGETLRIPREEWLPRIIRPPVAGAAARVAESLRHGWASLEGVPVWLPDAAGIDVAASHEEWLALNEAMPFGAGISLFDCFCVAGCGTVAYHHRTATGRVEVVIRPWWSVIQVYRPAGSLFRIRMVTAPLGPEGIELLHRDRDLPVCARHVRAAAVVTEAIRGCTRIPELFDEECREVAALLGLDWDALLEAEAAEGRP